MAKRKITSSMFILLLMSLFITTVSGVIYYQLLATLNIQAQVSPVTFTSGGDTATCGGTITSDASQVSFATVPLAVESDIIITELVNLTNTDASAHDVQVSVSTDDFGTELDALALYLVSPTATQTLVVELNGSGTVTTDDVTVNIPAGEEYAIKLVGHYNAGQSAATNSMTLDLQVTD